MQTNTTESTVEKGNESSKLTTAKDSNNSETMLIDWKVWTNSVRWQLPKIQIIRKPCWLTKDLENILVAIRKCSTYVSFSLLFLTFVNVYNIIYITPVFYSGFGFTCWRCTVCVRFTCKFLLDTWSYLLLLLLLLILIFYFLFFSFFDTSMYVLLSRIKYIHFYLWLKE